MARTPDGPPPPPTVQRLRICYAKRGRLRFTSHRDVARVLERALRRSQMPMAFSAGFSPHQKISYIGASPTGVASEAEYLEIGLAEWREPEAVRSALDAALPRGIDVLEVVTAGPGSLADRVTGSVWRVMLPGVQPAVLADALTAFLAEDTVPVERLTKTGRKQLDARAAVVSATASGTDCAILGLVVRHMTPAVRPDDVLAGLRAVSSLDWPSPPVATRLAQGTLRDDGEVTDPLEPDRLAPAEP